MQTLLEYNRKDLRNWAGEELAAKFFENRSKYPAPYNNLDYWISRSTPQDLEAYMNNYVSKNQKRKEEMAGADKLYDDGRWLVVHCKTYDAMKYYGKGTKWCIAGNYPGHETRGQYYFDSYMQERYTGYYVYIDREGRSGYDKWCVCPLQSNPLYECDIWDAPDRTVSSIIGAPAVEGLPSVSNFVTSGDTLIKVKQADESFALPENIKHIGRKAMAGLSASHCQLHDHLESIGSGAFAKSNFTDMIIPDSVTDIGTALFLMCLDIKEVRLGKGINAFTKNLFAFCGDLKNVYVDGIIESFDESSVDDINNDCCFWVRNAYKNSRLIDKLHDKGYKVVDANTNEVI